MKRASLLAAAVASLAVLALSANYEPAAAQKGGPGGGGGHGGSLGLGSGGHVGGGGRVGGGPAIRSGGRALTGSAPRAHAQVNHGGRRHVRHFRGGHVYGYAPFGYYGDDAYAGSCGYYYRRALATGSSYWWRRYYDCVED